MTRNETLCLGNNSILTFPQHQDMVEMLRVSGDGQVLFNYRQWNINTATDMFFRKLAAEAPQLCQTVSDQLNEELAACKAREAGNMLQLAALKADKEYLSKTNENLSGIVSGGSAGFWMLTGALVGAFVGIIATAWIMNRMRD